jgi:enoyl-CoA hydratase/carnithine racemase
VSGDDDGLAKLGNDDLDVAVDDDGLVMRATITRPDRRNALNAAVLGGLLDVAAAADAGDARVIVIASEGEVFSAGGDFTEMPIGGTAQQFRERFGALSEVMQALRDCSALTVAAVDGACLAGGFGLAAACEFIIASEAAEFGTPEVQVGLFPVQAMIPIMRTIPEKRGLELLFTGRRIDAEEAHELGLTTDVFPTEEFGADVDAFVDRLAASSPVMLSMGKTAYYEQRDRGFESALAYCREVISLLAMSEDTEEGIEAFLTDREPEWAGR